jgi:hypothetical protein
MPNPSIEDASMMMKFIWLLFWSLLEPFFAKKGSA